MMAMGRKYSLSKLQQMAQTELDTHECPRCHAAAGALQAGQIDLCYGAQDCGDDVYECYSYLDIHGCCAKCTQSSLYFLRLQTITL